jgi:hypothetical protein
MPVPTIRSGRRAKTFPKGKAPKETGGFRAPRGWGGGCGGCPRGRLLNGRPGRWFQNIHQTLTVPVATSSSSDDRDYGRAVRGRRRTSVRCRTAHPSDEIDFGGRPPDCGAMGVRTRGLDIKAGAAKLKADRAARLEAELVVDRWTGHRPRPAVVADHQGRADRGNPLARRLLPRLQDEPGVRSAHRGPSPAGFGRHNGARPAMLMVSGIDADAEAAWLVRVAAREPGPRRDRLMLSELTRCPRNPQSDRATRSPASRFMDAAQWLVLAA